MDNQSYAPDPTASHLSASEQTQFGNIKSAMAQPSASTGGFGADIASFQNIMAGARRRSGGAPRPSYSTPMTVGSQPMATGSSPRDPGSYSEGYDVSKLGVVTTPYGGNTRGEAFHPGVDVANAIGTPIPSFTSGTVSAVSTGHVHGEPRSYGNYVIVTDDKGDKHRYSHLNNAWVKIGDKVSQGQQLGAMGTTGATYSRSGGTGSHLDYRVANAFGKYVDPTQFIRQYYGS
jgi:murein DD-endopeptidase MepM/ murein hydrolase activator NlpD